MYNETRGLVNYTVRSNYLVSIANSENGCEFCQKYWTHPFMDNRDEIIVTRCEPSVRRTSSLKQCTKCGTYWEYHPGSYPNTLTKEEAFEYFGYRNF